jgi:hypothetical protein
VGFKSFPKLEKLTNLIWVEFHDESSPIRNNRNQAFFVESLNCFSNSGAPDD